MVDDGRDDARPHSGERLSCRRDSVLWRGCREVVSHVRPVDLLVVGFDGRPPLPPDVGRLLEQFQRSGQRPSSRRALCLQRREGRRQTRTAPARSLRTLCIGRVAAMAAVRRGRLGVLPVVPLDLQGACEVGLDLAAVEGLAYVIEPDTSALLMLVEPSWATELLDAPLGASGFPLVFGLLEPETMLLIGPHLVFVANAALIPSAPRLRAAPRCSTHSRDYPLSGRSSPM